MRETVTNVFPGYGCTNVILCIHTPYGFRRTKRKLRGSRTGGSAEVYRLTPGGQGVDIEREVLQDAGG